VPSAGDAALARIVRGEAGLIVAQLQRRLGNFGPKRRCRKRSSLHCGPGVAMGCQSIQEGGCRSRLGAERSICSGNALARSVSLMSGMRI